MKRALALVLCLALPAWAADDAPVVAPDVKCYTPEQRANVARALLEKDAEIESLKKDLELKPSPVVVVVLVAAGVLVGGAAGAATALALRK